jgi:hypothetical protein
MPAKKYIAINPAGVREEVTATVVSAGAGSDGAIPALDASGKLDPSVMPAGIGADTVSATATEALSAGDLVNLYNNGGVLSVRKADASAAAAARFCNGYVIAPVANAAQATVYKEGTVQGLSGLTLGSKYFLSASVAGGASTTVVTAAGQLLQYIGTALSAATLDFEPEEVGTIRN